MTQDRNDFLNYCMMDVDSLCKKASMASEYMNKCDMSSGQFKAEKVL